MNLREHIDQLNDLIREYPEAAELEVIAAKDDEGNGYNPIYFRPTIGHYDRDNEEFHDESFIQESIKEAIEGDYEPDEYPINAVCVN